MKAYELLLQTGWCQGDYARNENHADVSPDNPNASEFCTVGALQRVYGVNKNQYVAAVRKVEAAIRKQSPDGFPYLAGEQVLVKWNDELKRTRPEVVALLREADV